MIDRVYSFIGLATKAGKLVSGEESCEKTLKSGKAFLVIVSADASDNTKKKFSDMCKYRNVELRCYGEKTSLGKCIGKDIRSVIAITDRGFAAHLLEIIGSIGVEHGGV